MMLLMMQINPVCRFAELLLQNINVKPTSIKDSYMRQSGTSKTAKIGRFDRFHHYVSVEPCVNNGSRNAKFGG